MIDAACANVNLHIKEDLFKTVKYLVTGILNPKIEKFLKDGGAICCNYLVTSTTHLMCGENFDENEIAQAADLYDVPSINENWVIASVKLGRLACTKAYDPVPNKIFSQIYAAISQVSLTDRHRLYALITFNGGLVEPNYTNKTTHLICGVARGDSYQKAITVKNDNFSIVTPDWVIDSLNQRELLDPQLYHPRLLIVEPTSSKPFYQSTTSMAQLSHNSSDNIDKESLASILGFDFEEGILKSELSAPKDVDINIMGNISKISTSQTTPNSMLNQQLPHHQLQQLQQQQRQQQLARPTQQFSTQPQQQQIQQQQLQSIQLQQSGGIIQPLIQQQQSQQNKNILHQSINQQIRSIGLPLSGSTSNSTLQQSNTISSQTIQQQQKNILSITNNNNINVNKTGANRSQSVAENICATSSSPTGLTDLIRQQQSSSTQPQIITQSSTPQQTTKHIQMMAHQSELPGNQLQSQQVIINQQQQQSLTAPPPQQQQQQQIIINQGNQVVAQRHIINTSTAQGQQLIQNHLMSQRQQQVMTGHNQLNQAQQQASLQQQQQSPQQQQQQQIVNTQQPQKQQIQFINTSSNQQQIKIIQNQQQQQVQQLSTAPQQTNNKQQQSNSQSQPPAQRIIISQQQFNQLNPQQQQQLLQNSQNSNIVVINQSTNTTLPQQHPTNQPSTISNVQSTNSNGATVQQQTSPHSISPQTHQIIHQRIGQQLVNNNGQPTASIGQSQMMAQQQTIQNYIQQHGINTQQTPQQQQSQQQQQQQQSHQQQQPQQSTQQNQRIQFLQNLQQQQSVQQIKMQLQQVAVNSTLQQQQQSLPQTQLMASGTNQSVAPNINNNNGQHLQTQLLQQQSQQSSSQQIITNPTQPQPTMQPIQQLITVQQSGQQNQQPQQPKMQNQVIGMTPQQTNAQVQQQQQQPDPQWVSQPHQQLMQQQQQPNQQPPPSQQQQQILQHQPVQSAQFIRAARPQWPPQKGVPGPQRQLIHLDAQTHAHLQTLDPVRRTEYLTKLHMKQRERNLMLRQQVSFQARPGGIPGVPVAAGQRPPQGTQHIIVRSQMPAGLTQQQQVQWLQQQGARPLLVRGSAPGLSPITQSTTSGVQQSSFANEVNSVVVPQQQQQLQIQLQRQQFQRLQQMQQSQNRSQQNQSISPRGFVESTDVGSTSTPILQQTGSQVTQIVSQDPNGQVTQMNSKTKTALANMLSNRLSNNGSVQTGTAEQPVEPSAAGTLRLMTAQHNAALGQQPPPPPQRGPQDLILQQQQQQQLQQRRTLGNITNNQAPIQQVGNQMQTAAQQITLSVQPSQSAMKGPPFSPGRPPLPRPQFYGHNPNLKLPQDLFLLGCIFFLVEYDELLAKEVPQWKELIQKHGGEIESYYCQRVTHILCRSQRHGVVMQAIRDSKRCVTAYWLNDTILKKQVVPPWQALHLPMPSTFGTQRPATKHIIAISGFEGDERARIKQMVEESGAILTGYFSRHNTVLICKRPEGLKYKKAKEWAIPVVNTVWLSDILLGNLSGMSQYETAKYQQYNITGPFRIDYGLVPHLMNAWKSPINLNQESHERVKRCLSEPPPEPKPKKIRTSPPLEIIPDEINCTELPDPDKVPKIIFSQVDNIEGLTRAVIILGGHIVKDPMEATHIVLTRLTRTCKLILSVCVVKNVLTSKWIVDSAITGKLLPEDNYTWDDSSFKEIYQCNIQTTIQSPMRGKLFEGKTFYITPSVRPNTSILTRLIEHSGGKVEKHRKSAVKISETNTQSPGSYIILSCTRDLHLLADLMRPGKPNRIICATEYVLTSVMTQNIDLEKHVIKYL